MEKIADFLEENFKISENASSFLAFLVIILLYVLLFVLCYFGWKLLQRLNKKIFEKIKEKQGRSLTNDFLERVVSLGITLFFIILPFNWDSIRQSIFGSAAVLTAIIGFAAQDVIKDILAGLQMSIYKPFDIGDRIELNDGTAGIVENITMRHVVLKRIDTLRVVIPNSQMNEYSVLNYSYDDVPRSLLLKFPVSYKSDIHKTKHIIENVVKNSPYTIPGKPMPDGTNAYAPVYFISIDDSALIMSVTIYYDHGTPTEVVTDHINTSVFEALAENGIDVPYTYMNVVMKQ